MPTKAQLYGRQWRKAKALFLTAHPLCTMCEAQGRITRATVVDHIVPHRLDVDLFWDRDNWQSLCQHHHDSAKQQEEKLGFSTAVGADGWPLDPSHPANATRP